MDQQYTKLLADLQSYDQEHLLAHWGQLSADQRQTLQECLADVDFPEVQRYIAGEDGAPDWHALARKAHPPRAIRLTGKNEFTREEAVARGEESLRAGKVGMILVAGGQGTRLGFHHPKGLLPLGPVSNRTLFQIIADRLCAVSRRYQTTIPLYVMTSVSTHDETCRYFEEHDYLGLDRDNVRLFRQGMMPAIDRATGKILLDSPCTLALSPDGHGGMLAAFEKSGALEDARERGVEIIFYGQIDNPLLQVCDPALIGFHLLAESEMTTQVVEKRHPLERVGNVVEIDGKTQIIEYSDLPEDAARQETPAGGLYLWAGNLAVHVFSLQFLADQLGAAEALPVHRALKKVPHLDETGTRIDPPAANAVKFERFIFDLLPRAQNALVVEVSPAEAFAPVKNAPGEATDTAETARAAMIHRDRALLEAAGAQCAPDVAVEVNPLWALDSEEAATKLSPGQEVSEPTYFAPR